jgi:hypothetical protein
MLRLLDDASTSEPLPVVGSCSACRRAAGPLLSEFFRRVVRADRPSARRDQSATTTFKGLARARGSVSMSRSSLRVGNASSGTPCQHDVNMRPGVSTALAKGRLRSANPVAVAVVEKGTARSRPGSASQAFPKARTASRAGSMIPASPAPSVDREGSSRVANRHRAFTSPAIPASATTATFRTSTALDARTTRAPVSSDLAKASRATNANPSTSSVSTRGAVSKMVLVSASRRRLWEARARVRLSASKASARAASASRSGRARSNYR